MIKIVDCSELSLKEKSLTKNIYCFGAGKNFCQFIRENPEIHIKKVIDNFKGGEGNEIDIDGKIFPVISIEEFRSEFEKSAGVVITCRKYEEVILQLDSIPEFDNMECYIDLFLKEYTEHHTKHYTKYPVSRRKKDRIPKKIHYCWFGKNDLPKEYLEYMETWSKYCPDYEIIRWDEDNYDVAKNGYLKRAYRDEKWAFVSDYARVDVIYQYGGIYLDTDVELVKGLDDFLKWDMFCGFESSSYIAWGLGFGAVCGHEILKDVLEVYEQIDVMQCDGSLYLITCPKIQSYVMSKYGFKMDGTPQEINDIAVYPKEFFCPYSYKMGLGRMTENTYSIHHYAASWQKKNGSKHNTVHPLVNFVRQHQNAEKYEKGRLEREADNEIINMGNRQINKKIHA